MVVILSGVSEQWRRGRGADPESEADTSSVRPLSQGGGGGGMSLRSARGQDSKYL